MVQEMLCMVMVRVQGPPIVVELALRFHINEDVPFTQEAVRISLPLDGEFHLLVALLDKLTEISRLSTLKTFIQPVDDQIRPTQPENAATWQIYYMSNVMNAPVRLFGFELKEDAERVVAILRRGFGFEPKSWDNL